MSKLGSDPKAKTNKFYLRFKPLLSRLLLEPGHLEKDHPITKVFLQTGTNNFDEFEDCYLRGQVSSNGFKVFNGCMDEPRILLVRLLKKLEYLLFSKNIVIG